MLPMEKAMLSFRHLHFCSVQTATPDGITPKLPLLPDHALIQRREANNNVQVLSEPAQWQVVEGVTVRSPVRGTQGNGQGCDKKRRKL